MPARVEPPTLVIRCAWCGADQGRKPCAPAQNGQVSHSCCALCLARVEAEMAA